MLRNVFLKTLRDMRGQVLGWGLTIAIPTMAMILGFPLIQSTLDVEELFCCASGRGARSRPRKW